MATVTTAFKFYDDGVTCVLHDIGEEVTGSVEDYAISQGFSEGGGTAAPVPEATEAPKKRGRK